MIDTSTMEQSFEQAKQRLDAERRESEDQIRRGLRKAGDNAIAKIQPILEDLIRRRK